MSQRVPSWAYLKEVIDLCLSEPGGFWFKWGPEGPLSDDTPELGGGADKLEVPLCAGLIIVLVRWLVCGPYLALILKSPIFPFILSFCLVRGLSITHCVNQVAYKQIFQFLKIYSILFLYQRDSVDVKTCFSHWQS